MPDIISDVGTLGAEGFAVGGPVGGAIGAGVGLFESIFGGGEDPEEERQKRKRELIEAYKQAHSESLQRLFQAGSGLMANSRQAAIERAAAGGRTGEAESFILPAEANAAGIYTNALGQEEESYQKGLLDIESDFANRPIEPSGIDYLNEALTGLGKYKLNQDYIGAIRNAPIGGGSTGFPAPPQDTSGLPFMPNTTPGPIGSSLGRPEPMGNRAALVSTDAALADLERRRRRNTMQPEY